MARQDGLQADIARAVNTLGQFQGVDPSWRVAVGQAVQSPAGETTYQAVCRPDIAAGDESACVIAMIGQPF